MSGGGGAGGSSGSSSSFHGSGLDFSYMQQGMSGMAGSMSNMGSIPGSMSQMQNMSSMAPMHAMMPQMQQLQPHINSGNQSLSGMPSQSQLQGSGSGNGNGNIGMGGGNGSGVSVANLEDTSVIEMVSNAISTLSNKKGSSLQAIKKFLSEKYSIDVQDNTVKQKVSKAVKTGVNKGIFMQERNSYKLAVHPNDMRGMYSQPPHNSQYGQQGQWQHQFPGHLANYGGMQAAQFMPQIYQQQQYGQPNFGEGVGNPAAQGGDLTDAKRRKRRKKRKSKDGTQVKRRGRGGLTKPMNLSSELATVCGGSIMGRTDVVKQLWVYIKRHDLQSPQNKRKIVCDEALRACFNREVVDMFEMTKLISAHLSKPSEEEKEAYLQERAAATAAEDQEALLQDYEPENRPTYDEEDEAHIKEEDNAVVDEQWSTQ